MCSYKWYMCVIGEEALTSSCVCLLVGYQSNMQAKQMKNSSIKLNFSLLLSFISFTLLLSFSAVASNAAFSLALSLSLSLLFLNLLPRPFLELDPDAAALERGLRLVLMIPCHSDKWSGMTTTFPDPFWQMALMRASCSSSDNNEQDLTNSSLSRVKYRTKYWAPSKTFRRLSGLNSSRCLLHSRDDHRIKAEKTSHSPAFNRSVSLQTMVFNAVTSTSSKSSLSRTALASASINSRQSYNYRMFH